MWTVCTLVFCVGWQLYESLHIVYRELNVWNIFGGPLLTIIKRAAWLISKPGYSAIRFKFTDVGEI